MSRNPNAKTWTYTAQYFLIKPDGEDLDILDGYGEFARAFSQGTPGDITVDRIAPNGDVETVVIPGSKFPAGFTFLCQITKIHNSGTDATGIIAYL